MRSSTRLAKNGHVAANLHYNQGRHHEGLQEPGLANTPVYGVEHVGVHGAPGGRTILVGMKTGKTAMFLRFQRYNMPRYTLPRNAVPRNAVPQHTLPLRQAVLLACLLAIGGFSPAVTGRGEEQGVDFERDIAPILLRSCIGCHNASDPKSDLDLTRHASLVRGGESGEVIVAGKPEASYLFERLSDSSMPPPGKAPALTQAEIALVKHWILQGAIWPKDRVLSAFERTTDQRAGLDWWSLQPVVRPTPPAGDSSWSRNPIDSFIRKKLSEHGLAPNAEVDRVTFLRRAKFDLLGLPPTWQEIEAFVADTAPGAHARLIDRLLASPHYGERWGRHWLDVVRFTESDGFEHDKLRPHAWRYRDYVIRSFNDDKPYSEFVVEQLAGDAVETLSRDSIVATGFLVAGPWDEVQNVGASKSEMRRAKEEQTAEMIDAISQSFLGMTVGCARCHDHKFDPIPQRDYYSIKAVFDGVDHSQGRTVGNRPILTPAEQEMRRVRLAPLEKRKNVLTAKLAEMAAHTTSDAVVEVKDKAVVPGRFGQALHARATTAKAASKPQYHKPPLTIECWVRADSKSKFNVFVANHLKSSSEHWELYSYAGQGDFSVYLPGYSPVEIRSGVDITDGQWHYLATQFDGRQVHLYVDGECVKQQAVKRMKTDVVPGDLFFGGYPPQKIGCDGAVDEVRISRGIVPIEKVPQTPFAIDENTIGLWRFDQPIEGRFADDCQPDASKKQPAVAEQRDKLKAEIQQIEQSIASHTVPLSYIGFRQQPPATHVLLRGNINTPGPQVAPCALSSIPEPAADLGLEFDSPEAQRRLRFARWVADAENPLTARVMVNRIWQHHFGRGLVATPSDFGFNAGTPSHPRLLDWLAAEFVRSGWSIKHMHRLMMLSATYRQSTRARDDAALSIDAENRLLWRFPPSRLEGEIARDAMLAVSGDLNRRLGGPSFQPFKVTVFNTHFYHLFDSDQPEFARRTVYRANVITGRDPLLDALDCPAPAVQTPRRRTTVTPLQALSLMNDSFVIRQADRFAARVVSAVGEDPERQARLAYRMAISRDPTAEELAASVTLIREHNLASVCWALFNSSEFLYVQ